jgi:hypothetical protein
MIVTSGVTLVARVVTVRAAARRARG